MTVYEELPPAAAVASEAVADHAAAAAPGSGLPSAHPSPSYWLRTPSPLLTGHCSTPDLPSTVDVVVVGSGITGAFAADVLAGASSASTASPSVLLLEAREVCSGATGRNGGHCQPMVYASSPAVAGFELATFHFLERFVREHDVPCDWRTLPGGGVHAYLDADLFAAAVAVVEALAMRRPDLAAQVTVVRPDAAAATPSSPPSSPPSSRPTLASLRLRGDVAGALVQRHAASVWPYKLVAWVLERLVTTRAPAQFNLQTNTPVLRLVRCDATAATAAGADGADGARWAVETPRGIVRARAVLLATNGYTAHLLPPSLSDLIVPVRGQVAALVPPTHPSKSTSTTSETRSDTAAATAASTSASTSTVTSASASAAGRVSRSSVTVTKTANGQTTTTTTTTTTTAATTTADAPADRLTSSYVFVGHDHDLGGTAKRDEYLVQRPFVAAAHDAQPVAFATAGAASTSASASVSAAASSSAAPPRPTAGGHLVFGGGRERAAGAGIGEWRDDVVEAPVAAFLRTHLAPELDVGGDKGDDGVAPAPLKADFEWTGIMGFSRDQQPWVGRVPTSMLDDGGDDSEDADADSTPSGLYIAAGFTGHGMPSTSLCGRAVARMILEDLGCGAAAAETDADADHPLPASLLMTPSRLRRVRQTCPTVAEADTHGFAAEFRALLAARLAGE